MKTKIVAFIMSIIFCITFAACGAGKSNTNTGTENSQTVEVTTKETPKEPVKTYILTKVEAGTELPDDQLVLDYIKKEISVEPIMIKTPAGTYEEKLNIMLSSGEPLDAFVAVNNWNEYQKKGMIRDINDLLESNGQDLKRNYTTAEWDFVTDKTSGKIFAIPFASTPLGNAPRIRADWLEKLGLSVPTNLNEFEKVLEAFHTTDKLGKNIIPLVTHLSYQQMDRAFMGLWTQNGDHNWIDSDGKVKPAILHPAYKDYIAKMAEWYAKGYIWKEAFTQEFTTIKDLVAQNRVGVLASWVSVGMTEIQALMEKDPTVKYQYMDKFEGPAGSAYSLRLPTSQGVVFSINSKNAEAAVEFFNWGVANRTNRNIVDFGIEGKHWKWIDQDKGIIERVEGADKQYSQIYSLVQGAINLGSSDNSVGGKLWTEFFNFTSNPNLQLKLPGDYGTFYDEAAINATVPSVADIDKFRDQWLVKFIMGQEPMSKWDKFITELRAIGLDKLVDERTKQYNASK